MSLAAAALILTAACGRPEGGVAPPTLTRARPAGGTPVEAVAPDPGFVGVVVTGDWTDLEPKVEGRIEELLVKAGDRLEAGAVVARLDVQAAEIELQAARAAWRDARGRYQRRRKLVQKKVGVVAQEELDGIRREMLEARARMARMSRARREATVATPFAGSVVEVYLAVGAAAGPGRPVVRLAARGEPRVRFAVPQESRGRVVPDAAVRVELAQPRTTLRARVSGVSPDVDDASGMVFATATLDGPATAAERGALATGMVARVFLAGAR
jgi:RND family efflux transporter MFP subunit